MKGKTLIQVFAEEEAKMSISPEILKRMQGADSAPLNRSRLSSGGLCGTAKQVKWASAIRGEALDNSWPTEEAKKLENITDATWWIANRDIVNTLKYKEPTPAQLLQSELTEHSPVKTVKSAWTDTRRMSDALEWARSVSRNPRLANAAILATLACLYTKDSNMREQLCGESERLLEQGEDDTAKDIDAIKKMIWKAKKP